MDRALEREGKMSLQMLLAIASIASHFSVNVYVVHNLTVAANQAVHAIGERRTVCGVVSHIQQPAGNKKARPTFITLGAPGTTPAFKIVIMRSNLHKFEPQLHKWTGERICVKGKIRLYDNRPIIIADNTSEVDSRH